MGLPYDEWRRAMCQQYGWAPHEFDLTPEDDLYLFALLPSLHAERLAALRRDDPDWATRPARTDGRAPISVDRYA